MAEMNDVFAVARIRAKEKNLLTDADINQLVSMKDAGSVLAYLRDRGWGEEGADNDAEAMLLIEEKRALALMKELGVSKDVLDILEYPNLYHNLKTAIKEICTEGEHPLAFYESASLGRTEMLQLLRDKAYNKFPSHMKSTAVNAYETMVQTMDGQMCDVIVDRGCLDAMQKVAVGSKHQILRDYEAMTVAVTDIRIAVRAARTGKTINFLKAALAPCPGLNIKKMAQAASEGIDSLYTFLSETRYSEAVDALKVSDATFEKWCDNRLIESIRPQKRNPFTLGPVVAYYLARRNEIKTARIILTAKANDLPEEAVRERMRDMYV